jgi:phenylalanyl-tRNA synthetase beta chain
MKFPVSWLKDYIDIASVPLEELCDKLTMLGLEIESVEEMGEEIQNVKVGLIKDIQPHPDADKLSVCTTDVGDDEALQIVCGAQNIKVGDKVPTAVIGGTLPGGTKIKKGKLRGVESRGMMCSARELGLGDDHSGLLILNGDPPIGEDVKPILGLDDVVLEIEVTPNRNDWSGLIGIARELSALYERPLTAPEIIVQESSEKTADCTSVTIENPELCGRYAARVIKNVKVEASPEWLQKRLLAAGQRPINNIVDVTNYVLLETGQPLHAFDYNKLAENRIVVRAARAGETITTLDKEKRTLQENMLVIADAKEPIAVAGIMGGADSEVGESTQDILVESAWFDPGSIRKTSRILNLTTEASQRFQRGADFDMVPYAADRVCELVLQTAGGTLCAGTVDETVNEPEISLLTLRFERTNTFLGTNVSPETQMSLIESLGFCTDSSDEESATFIIPPRRHDVTREADLIEEVLRLYGFENIEPTLPKIRPTANTYSPNFPIIRNLKNYLTDIGLTEIFTWTFTSETDINQLGIAEMLSNCIPIENPLSESQGFMRPSLIPGLLRTASANIRKNINRIAVFELGNVFAKTDSEEPAKQTDEVDLVLSGPASHVHWDTDNAKAFDIYDAIGITEGILAELNLRGRLEFKLGPNTLYDEDHSLEIVYNQKNIGSIGRINNDILNHLNIEQDIIVGHIKLESLLNSKKKKPKYSPLSEFPPSKRDIAIVVDDSVKADHILQIVQKSAGKLLHKTDIFDVYRGKNIPQGKKSVGIMLVFQSNERTLTEKDTEKAWSKIVQNLEKQVGAELR